MSGPSGFLTKTFEIFSTPEYAELCGWGPKGDTIYVRKIEEFSKQILPKYFKHSNFQSFVRQLNMYDFHKTVQDPNNGEFQHLYFRKDRPELMALIKRKANCRTTETSKKMRPVTFPAVVKSEPTTIISQDEQLSFVDPDSLYVVGQEQMVPDVSISAPLIGIPSTLILPPPVPLLRAVAPRDDLEQRVRDLESVVERVHNIESQNARILGENQMLVRLVSEMRGKQLSLQDRFDTVLRRLYTLYVAVINGLSNRTGQVDAATSEQVAALSTALTRRPSMDRHPTRDRPPLHTALVMNSSQKETSGESNTTQLPLLTEEDFMELYRVKDQLNGHGTGRLAPSGRDAVFGLELGSPATAGSTSSGNDFALTKQTSFDAAASSITPPFAANGNFGFYSYESANQEREYLSNSETEDSDRIGKDQQQSIGGERTGGGALVRQAAFDLIQMESARKKQRLRSPPLEDDLLHSKSTQLVPQSSMSSFGRMDSFDSTLSILQDFASGDNTFSRQSSIMSNASDGGPLMRLSSVLTVGDSRHGDTDYDKKASVEDIDVTLSTDGDIDVDVEVEVDDEPKSV